jgi:hypothetical protein
MPDVPSRDQGLLIGEARLLDATRGTSWTPFEELPAN